jgi:hypothetical protein
MQVHLLQQLHTTAFKADPSTLSSRSETGATATPAQLLPEALVTEGLHRNVIHLTRALVKLKTELQLAQAQLHVSQQETTVLRTAAKQQRAKSLLLQAVSDVRDKRTFSWEDDHEDEEEEEEEALIKSTNDRSNSKLLPHPPSTAAPSSTATAAATAAGIVTRGVKLSAVLQKASTNSEAIAAATAAAVAAAATASRQDALLQVRVAVVQAIIRSIAMDYMRSTVSVVQQAGIA